jgi:DNA-binding transcriptional regulator PaaX
MSLVGEESGRATAGQQASSDQATAAQASTGQGGWLLLVYRVPSEPTRLRAAVWRRLKSLGAIYLQNSAAALPASVAAERSLRKLRSEILEMSGTAALLSCTVLAGEQEVRAAFQAARDDEYEEIADKCEDFLAGVKKEYAASHFTYAELEENEVDLVKLKNWLERVRQRDVFGAAGRQAAETRLAECEQALETYAARVYAEEGESG